MEIEVFSRKAARAAKERGLANVAKGASLEWVLVMEQCLLKVLRAQRRFTSDDVFKLALSLPKQPETRDRRAFGPIMIRANRAGWCVLENVAPIRSARRSLHASPRQVWRSLLYKGKTL